MRSLVVGGAGFIGSHLVGALVSRGPVTVYDDLSVGHRAWLAPHLDAGRAEFVVGDALDLPRLTEVARGHDVAFHLAANPEARHGLSRTRLDLEQGTTTCYHALEACRLAGVPRFVLSSSGTVYGDTARVCREEDLGALPISLYGASKLACEALTSAFVECFGLEARIFRFGNVVGPHGTHGAALDFLRKLERDGTTLEVLGDGKQRKPYLHVSDCVAGILHGLDHGAARLEIYNLTPPDTTTVARIAELCVAASPHPGARIHYTGGDRGWPGDIPRSMMAPDKLAAAGFRVRLTSDAAVRRAVGELAGEVFGARARPLEPGPG
ncbi:MAG: NAD-dependent epimerase/dehydratase family protein [Myxococcales bacterium]|nr:NAD-dependent epimerase/dehydratase family protein [Myxococcales bacterium]